MVELCFTRFSQTQFYIMNKKLLYFSAITALLAYPASKVLAQAPTLGTAANFALFTSSGAVTNTGISQVTGHVGTNSGSTTGFGNVNGVMNDNNGATAAVTSDLLIVYNQLDNTIPDYFPAPLLGGGDTLTEGTYQTAGVTTLGGNLFLDAEGDSNALFIFQIEAAFSVSAAAKVILLHGAQACNVFWKIEGATDVASGAYLRGTFIGNNAAIALGVNDTLEGRVLSTAGAVTTNGVMVYTPVGCGSPVLTGPVAPLLIATGDYAVFSGNGSVTNAGISYVTGDVGTNVGLTTGFDPLYVDGMIHPTPDGSTAAAAADLLLVNTYLDILPADIELLYPAQFGNDLVLTPHTYVMNGAASLTGNVYLNAQGNPDAVFVIKIYGALSTSTFSNVILTNGAQSANVYWSVAGAVTINDYSIFNGNIFVSNGAINLGTGDSISGRMFTGNGAIATSAIEINIPSSDPLSVSWLYFRGTPAQQYVALNWATSSEADNDFFTIEKSRDGLNFDILTTVKANTTNTDVEHHYSFTDQHPFLLNYYRISQTDISTRREYFQTIQVRMKGIDNVQSNHFVEMDYIRFQTSGSMPSSGSIALYSIDGRKISSQNITLGKETSIHKIEKPSVSGIYFLYVEASGTKLYTSKVLIP